MSLDVLLMTTCIVLVAIAWLALRQRDAARRDAERSRRLARIGASVDGIAHDLGNVLTTVPYFLEAALDREDDEERRESERELQGALLAATTLLHELHRYAEGRTGADGGSLTGVVRLVAAGLRFRGPKILMEVDGDLRYGPGDLDLLDRVRDVMMRAVEEAGAIERCVVRVDLDDSRLVIEHPKPGYEGEVREAEIGTGWRLSRRVEATNGDVLQVRIELARTPAP